MNQPAGDKEEPAGPFYGFQISEGPEPLPYSEEYLRQADPESGEINFFPDHCAEHPLWWSGPTALHFERLPIPTALWIRLRDFQALFEGVDDAEPGEDYPAAFWDEAEDLYEAVRRVLSPPWRMRSSLLDSRQR